MKVFIQDMYNNNRYGDLFKWGRLIVRTGSAQALIQIIGLLSGVLIIRILPTTEYALYTLVSTMLGTMLILADGGISAGVMFLGGKVWQDYEKLGKVLITGFDLRKRFAIYSLIVSTPILLYLIRSHGASWMMTVLLLISIIPAFLTSFSAAILEVAPKLQQDIKPLQKNQIIVSISRLALSSIVLYFAPLAFVIVLASGIPQIWANKKLKKIANGYADWNQNPDLNNRRDILLFVRRIMPGSIYYCLSGQITIWLVAIFGSTVAIAQIGALNRLSMMLSLFSVLFNTLVLPRFARLPNSRHILLNRYVQVQTGFVIISIFIIGCVWMFPSEALWILGKRYSDLTNEVLLSVVNGCIGLVVGSSFSICASRGWAINPLISIPVAIITIIISIFIYNIGSLEGILKLNITVAVVEAFMYILYNMVKIATIKEEQLIHTI